MKVTRRLEVGGSRSAPAALTIGVFDGVHLGHRKVIRTLMDEAGRLGARAVVLTFDPHPRRVLNGSEEAPLITSVKHRLRLLAGLGVPRCVLLPFDGSFARMDASDFVSGVLVRSMNLRLICVGPDFSFGSGGKGGVKLLERLGAEHGFSVKVVDDVSVDGIAVSSTAIRAYIKKGDIARASLLLGRRYSLLGTVIRGKALGRALGVPTANIAVEGELLPPAGVYTARALRAGKSLPGVLNVDWHGTVEVHIFDLDEDLYGEELEIEVGEKIREEQAFEDPGDLERRMRCDIAIARQMLHNNTTLSGGW